MTKATDKILGELHGKLAESMIASLEQSDRASLLIVKYRGELPDDVVELLEDMSSPSPALLASITKFLKDNSITCAIEENNDMTELQKRLAEKKRKRVGNVHPIEE